MDPVTEAISQANRSPMLHRHGAVIVRNGVIVGKGFNHHVDYFHHSFSLHAEVDAIMDLRKKYAAECRSKKWIRECRLYVVRVSGTQELRLSQPCRNCRKCIEGIGIPVVMYSA